MLCIYRLILTAGIFVTLIGGTSQTLKNLVNLLGINWGQVLDSYKLQIRLSEESRIMDIEDSIILNTIQIKDNLIKSFLNGKASLLQTAYNFRLADQQIVNLKNQTSHNSDFYYQQVACWAITFIRRHSPQEEVAVVQMIKCELDNIAGVSNYHSKILDRSLLN